MKNKEIRELLKKSCKHALTDLAESIGFNHLEYEIFKDRYIEQCPKLKWNSCLRLHIRPTLYNEIHNNILSKVEVFIKLNK